MVSAPPTGIITLMFTDIQASTALWEKMGEGFRPVLRRHNELIREFAQRWDGYEIKNQGDSFMIAFARASDAIY
ncbi:MAG TPA: adenylate/guanylate cyclase domain-containing protein, partial [Abditibacteriaceae bacterium]|nr:adenylate/guanylate cyclase domain-containing protein [Abditibacteriaceae bacterium]